MRHTLLLLLLWLTACASAGTPASNTHLDAETAIKPPEHTELSSTMEEIPESNVFGANLFTSNCASSHNNGINPNYRITQGDKIHLQLWGAYTFSETLTVDNQGNIFIPEIGPVKVFNEKHGNLNAHITKAIKRTFKSNVHAYANLETRQNIQLYVTGYVNQPGLVAGLSSDSVLYFLCQAGGINLEEGSFRKIEVLRNNAVFQKIDVYEFLLGNELPLIQFHDGDTISVKHIGKTVTVTGDVSSPYQFELLGQSSTVDRILNLAHPLPNANYVRIIDHNHPSKQADYAKIRSAKKTKIYPGATLEVNSDKSPNKIVVKIDGAISGPHQYVLPVGTKLNTLLARLPMTQLAATDSIQLYRTSVAQQQKSSIIASLDNLEKTLFTTRSVTPQGAQIRNQDAQNIMRFIERARKVEPKGQIALEDGLKNNSIILKDDDQITIPEKSSVVLVSGQVSFPSSFSLENRRPIRNYITQAGGYSENAETSYVLVASQNGIVKKVSRRQLSSRQYPLRGGDEIIIPAKPDVKNLQIASSISQIIYQVAIAAKVAIGI